MKTSRFLWMVPLAGLLTFTACQTTPPAHSPPTAAAEPAPAAAEGSSYLVSLVKNAPAMVAVGDQFAYALTVTARDNVSDTTVSDKVPAGASFVSSVPPATPDGKDGNKLTWNLGNLNRNESRTIKVLLKAEKEGELVDCATVSAFPRVCVTTMVGRPQLTIKKTGPELAMLGQDVTYVVAVQNTGNTVAKNVVVTDTVPEGMSSASGQKELSFDLGDLPPGASKTVNVVLKANKRGKVCNKATAAIGQGSKVNAEVCTTIIQAGLKIAKTTKDTELFVNRAATYDIVVSNTGDTDLTGVIVTDTAAPETVIATADGATVTGTTASWNIGELKAGAKKTLTVKVLSKVPGRFCDTASVTCTQGLKDSAQTCTLWKGVTGVLLEMVDDPDPIQVGETTKFSIRVANQGTTIDISTVAIVATLPAELEVVPGTVSDGGVVSGQTITWPTIPAVGPKASVVRSYIAKGVKAGDARSKVAITTSMRKEPIEKSESTTVY